MVTWLLNKLQTNNSKLTLLGYFSINKFTFPIKNFITYSHSNVNDIEFLRSNLKNFTFTKLPHKDYDFIYKLNNVLDSGILETVIIVDESCVKDEHEVISTLFDILNSTKSSFIEKTNNVIKVNFGG